MNRILPVLFNTDMVRAVLEGRKTVTRRVIKPQPKMKLVYACMGHECGKWLYSDKNAWKFWGREYRHPDTIAERDLEIKWTPPCHTGDILYVRETWQDLCLPVISGEQLHDYVYKAGSDDNWIKWRSSIHMPKKAARIWLKVMDVRVERLQDITEEQAKAEGAVRCYEEIQPEEDTPVIYQSEDGGYYTLGFKAIWNSLTRKPDIETYGWDANPWVWVIAFEQCEKPESEEI